MSSRRVDDDGRIDRLYQLPLGEFTAARNALAKELGSGAPEIRKLQKPPVAAWAINQLFWRDRKVYDPLIAAAEALRAAHRAVLAGRRGDLRAAGKVHEEALDEALRRALAILKDDGHPPTDAVKQAISTTLRSLPSSDTPGRLGRVLQPAGFEALAGMPVHAAPVRPVVEPAHKGAASRSTGPAARATTPVDARAVAKAKAAAETAARQLREAEQALRRDEFESARAAREVERHTRAVEQAREALAQASRALEEAERDAAAASKTQSAAERRVDSARDAVRSAREHADTAHTQLAEASRPKPRR